MESTTDFWMLPQGTFTLFATLFVTPSNSIWYDCQKARVHSVEFFSQIYIGEGLWRKGAESEREREWKREKWKKERERVCVFQQTWNVALEARTVFLVKIECVGEMECMLYKCWVCLCVCTVCSNMWYAHAIPFLQFACGTFPTTFRSRPSRCGVQVYMGSQSDCLKGFLIIN